VAITRQNQKPRSFKVLTRISWMILHICDVPSHFQESTVWNYLDFRFEDMGYMKKYLVCQTRLFSDVYDYMNIRTVDPLLKYMHEFSLQIFYGGLCHLWLYIFNKIKVYWNVWVFDYFHSSFCIGTGWFVVTLTIRFLNITYLWKFFSVIKKS
jgi:hypothetical protein